MLSDFEKLEQKFIAHCELNGESRDHSEDFAEMRSSFERIQDKLDTNFETIIEMLRYQKTQRAGGIGGSKFSRKMNFLEGVKRRKLLEYDASESDTSGKTETESLNSDVSENGDISSEKGDSVIPNLDYLEPSRP